MSTEAPEAPDVEDVEDVEDPDLVELAASLQSGISAVVRRLRQLPTGDDLSTPERSALSRLGRDGPATSAEMARAEGITPQSMGATMATLEARGLVDRGTDPEDRRRVVMSLSDAGATVLRHRKDARTEKIAQALVGLGDDDLRHLGAAARLLEQIVVCL